MVRSIEEIRTLMDKKHNIRNISVISHAEHGKSTPKYPYVPFSASLVNRYACFSRINAGKSTLTGSLLAAAGLMSIEQVRTIGIYRQLTWIINTQSNQQVGNARLTDTRADEVARGFTIKSTGISLYLQASDDALRNFRGRCDYY